jgi:PAS domain S-box-containing protein
MPEPSSRPDLTTAHQLQAERQRFQALLAAVQEAVVWVTPAGQARPENELAAQLFDEPVAGGIRSLASLAADWVLLRPDGRTPDPEPFAAAAAGRSIAPTTMILRRRGFPDALMRVCVTPVLPMPGQEAGSLLTLLDLTDGEGAWRSELTQALTDKVHQLAAIVGHIADGVVVASAAGEILMVNEAGQRMLRLPPDADVSTLDGFDVRTVDGRPVAPDGMPVRRVLSGERIGEMVLRVVGPDGGETMLCASGSPILDEAQRVIMGVIVFHDVTEEHRLRRALTDKVRELEKAVVAFKELDLLKTDFLNAISHELRTPLTNVIGYVELLEDEVVGCLNPAQHDAIGKVMDSARHLLTLINDLLDFMQLEAGKVTFTLGPLDLPALVAQVLPAVRTKSGKRLETGVTVEPGLPRALGDHHRVMQVLEHLLDNAFKFTHEGGRIDVAVGPDAAGGVRVAVSDTGIGIPDEAIPKLFSKFYQVESGLRREQGGTGLGLAICKMLVERQGGRIGLTSRWGEGTTVWFTLPPWRGRVST